MKIIKCLFEHITSELNDADTYAELALKYKPEDAATAKIFYDLSLEEVKHYTKLHDRVVALINDYKSKNGEAPEGMKALYDYVHEQMIEHAKEVKILQDMF